MLSQQLNTQPFAQFAAEVFSDTGQRLTQQQEDIAATYYNRTGYLSGRLSSGPYRIIPTANGITLLIDYPKYIRFLDLKKTASGRPKKYYHPIYNRPLYGFVFGYAYQRLRYGLAANIKDGMAHEGKLTIEVSI